MSEEEELLRRFSRCYLLSRAFLWSMGLVMAIAVGSFAVTGVPASRNETLDSPWVAYPMTALLIVPGVVYLTYALSSRCPRCRLLLGRTPRFGRYRDGACTNCGLSASVDGDPTTSDHAEK